MNDDAARSETATSHVDPDDFADLSLTEALGLEADIENQYEDCPECGSEYLEVGIYNGGTVQFIHEKDGMVNSGCELNTREEIVEVLPYDVE